MKHTNSIEDQMRRWTPRRPSPELEQRIFNRTPEQETVLKPRDSWQLGRWLAPALCVLVLCFAGYRHPHPPKGTAPVDPGLTVNLFASNAISLAAIARGETHSHRNQPMPATFEWTNRTASPSTMRTSPLSMTNLLH